MKHSYVDGSLNTNFNSALADIFHGIIVDSNRPALAIQAVFTTLYTMSIYDFLRSFDFSAPATYLIKIEASVPTKVDGAYGGVDHCVFTITTLLMFGIVAKESPFGNSRFAVI